MVAPRVRCSSTSSARSSPRMVGSRFESGSSKRNTCGSRTRARPSAARCRSPPESSPGRRSSTAPSPRRSAACWTRRSTSAGATCRTSRPNAILLRTVRWGYSACVWNTIAMLRAAGSRRVTSRSPIRISPALGCSSPATHRSTVVFPDPDGPSSTNNSPSCTSRDTSSRTALPVGSYRLARRRSETDAMDV